MLSLDTHIVIHALQGSLSTLEICLGVHGLDFSSDPADEIIASTSIVHRVPLVTRDGKIQKSKIVPLASFS